MKSAKATTRFKEEIALVGFWKWLWMRIWYFLSWPRRRYQQRQLLLTVSKNVEIYMQDLRYRKPHWNERMIRDRAFGRYFSDLKKVGVL